MSESAKEEAKEWIKDIVVALLVISILMGALYAYTGLWPPMVVVESGSMQHSNDRSYIGVIDTGDIVLSKKVSPMEDIKTYVEGRAIGYEKYGDYGDVIIYHPLGLDVTPIIHRAVLYMYWNSTGSFDVPGLKHLQYGRDYATDSASWHGIRQEIVIYDYGYAHRDLHIDVNRLLRYHHGGYLTAGDHNVARGYSVDQNSGICAEPIKTDWVMAKAVGELPWFGLIKLSFSGSLHENPAPTNSWVMLIISLSLLIVAPMLVEKLWDTREARRKQSENEEEQRIEDGDSPENEEGENR